ncbi:MAG: tetratricopeptide repeat protein [Verrucomicrobiota bacterium]|nr:tetratricopeptide repeat protein [Verrucomicrobiota bacterium]
MNTSCRITWRAVLAGLILAPLLLGASPARAEVRGAVIKINGQRVPNNGLAPIRWLPSQKKYLIGMPGGVTIQIALDQVKGLDVPKPANLDAAVQYSQRTPSSAIPTLEGIVKEYTMLKWDVSAARWLAEAYLKMKKPKEAVEYLDMVADSNPDAIRSGEICRTYWQALRQAGLIVRLKKTLLDAIESGPRDTVAMAQIARGDIEMDAGNTKDALVDGYLRTIMLFQDVKHAQPEALAKAMKAHEKLGEHSHAEKWKRKLLNDYPESSYSRNLKGLE